MALSRGKQFEDKLKSDFSKVPGSHIERIYDNVSGYKSIRGRSDFIGYIFPNMFFLECKSHKGNTFPFAELRQYEDLLEVSGIHGIRCGVVLWMIDHDLVVYIPISTVKKMRNNDKKSFNVKDLENGEYKIIKIPSKKKRVFMDSDYRILTTLEDGD